MDIIQQSRAETVTGAPSGRDSLLTVAGVGVVAYVVETLGHEALGHAGACLLSGGHITAVAPLWMRCSVQGLPIVAAGPALNLVLAAVFGLCISGRNRARALDLFLWLGCAFNLLVACGYLVVGGLTGFGDWGVLFASVSPAWAWRVPAVAIGAGAYLAGLRVLGRLYIRMCGLAGLEKGRLTGRTLLPGSAAAIVAVGAELAGGRAQIGGLALATGCTLVVGWSLMSIDKARSAADQTRPIGPLVIRRSIPWMAAALVVAALFILVVGRGAP